MTKLLLGGFFYIAALYKLHLLTYLLLVLPSIFVSLAYFSDHSRRLGLPYKNLSGSPA